MAERTEVLFMQTDSVKRHRHIVVLQPEGVGQTSLEGKGKREHDHQINRDDESGEWTVSGGDHDHILEPVKTNRPVKKEKEIDKVTTVIQLYKEARKREEESRKRGELSEKFYEGDQWKKEDKDVLEADDRASLVYNEIETKVDTLDGYQSDNRSEIRYFPTEGGDQGVADLLNIFVKNICYQNNYEWEESRFFKDLMIPGRGAWQMWEDFEKNIEGDIRMGRFPWDEVFFGPHSDPMARDAEYMGKHKWYSKAKVQQLWPDKFKQIETLFRGPQGSEEEFETDDTEHIRREGQQYGVGQNKIPFRIYDPDRIKIARNDVKVIELQRKEYEGIYVIFNEDLNIFEPVSGWTAKQIGKVKTIPGFNAIKREAHRIRVTRVAGNILLDDEYPENQDDFDIIMTYGKFRGKTWWSFVHKLKDPNREINKGHSQFIDIIRRNAAYGWGFDEDTFPTPQDADTFKDISSTPGFVTQLKNVERPPHKFEGLSKPPTEIVQALALVHDRFESLANVPPSLEALEKSAASGAALIQKERRGLIGNRYLFDAISMVKQEIGRRLIKMIRDLYGDDPDRILRVVRTERSRQPEEVMKIGGIALEEIDDETIVKLLETDDLENYDVVVSEAQWTPTMRLANWHQWTTLAQHTGDVPLEMLVDLSNLPKEQKERYLESIAQRAQKQEQMEMAKYGVELEKARTAAESRGGEGGTTEEAA
jgi:uncharacterized protein YozE (UPF0346 family)